LSLKYTQFSFDLWKNKQSNNTFIEEEKTIRVAQGEIKFALLLKIQFEMSAKLEFLVPIKLEISSSTN